MTSPIHRIPAFLLLLFACLPVIAQAPQTTPPAPQKPPAQEQKKLSAAEQQELLQTVDDLLKFASQATHLAIKGKVGRELASRDVVQKFIEERLKEDKDVKRLERSERLLKKFGLVPRDFELKSFLVELLREQVAGFYDPKRKTVFLLDWVDPQAQEAVLAHELTHALQDQQVGLETWTRAPEGGREQPKPDTSTDQVVMSDEQVAARQAVVEGQAMITLVDYSLASLGRKVEDAPEIVAAIREGMSAAPDSPVYNRAPRYIRDVLAFPYRNGLGFVREVLVQRGREAAFAGLLKNPPLNTRQVLEPATYLGGEKLPPLRMVDFGHILGRAHTFYDYGVLGQFDIAVLAAEFGDPKQADSTASAWRGGYYYATEAARKPDGILRVAYVSRWADAAAAAKFAELYGKSILVKYSSAEPVKNAPVPTWNTSEGRVTVETRGDTVLALESFDAADAARIREAVFGRSAAVAAGQ